MARPRETFSDVNDYVNSIICDSSYGCMSSYDEDDSSPMVFSPNMPDETNNPVVQGSSTWQFDFASRFPYG
ncbi:hypothetical protein Q1695_000722 [Nippostrongylus brasiliensis]|nr:hypothetical protein Q1695_000722 [Nippostrongylus brasiliensis]